MDDATIQRLIEQGGNAYVRNLVAAEAAVRRGEFNLAKVLRVAAYTQRALALRLARIADETATPAQLLRVNLTELGELGAAFEAFHVTGAEAGMLSGQVAASRQTVGRLLRQAMECLETSGDVLDAGMSEILWVCLQCGGCMEQDCPDLCPVCGAGRAEFAWFGPFYVENPEHLGWLSPPEIVATLETVPGEVAGLVASVADDVLCRRPSPEQWCVKEILGHLIETDRLFAKRVALILGREDVADLTTPGPPWKKHEGKGYEEWPTVELLASWREARTLCLSLVCNLAPQEWSRHGTLGGERNVSLSDLGVWLANHDVGHREQIRRLCGQRSA